MKSIKKLVGKKLIIGVAFLIVVGLAVYALQGWHQSTNETAFDILKSKVLKDPALVEGAEVLEQTIDTGWQGSYLYVKARLASDSNIPDLSSPSVIKFCDKEPGNCTQPAWTPYAEYVEKYPTVTLSIPRDVAEATICTGHWDRIVNDIRETQDIICVNRDERLLWYQF